MQLWIAASDHTSLLEHADSWAPRETGGILVGYWSDDTNAVITTTIGPGENARHRTYGFHPDAAYQQSRLADLYEASGRLDTYLGDWHTHPSGGVGLSRRDRRTMHRIASDPEARCGRPIMFLLARSGACWTTAAWTGEPTTRRVEPAVARVVIHGEQ